MMIGGGRASKKQIIYTEDNEPPSYVHAVISYDELLIEILLRLPAISLRHFKYVSKPWLPLITDPNFIMSQNTKTDSPSGLFLRRPEFSFRYVFVPLDSRIPTNRSPLESRIPANRSPLNVASSDFRSDSHLFEILDSCNGLLLCNILPYNFYVYNPSTNQSKMLPPYGLTNFLCLVRGIKLVFDPTKSPHYKVLVGQRIHDARGSFFQIETFSSKTENWSVCGDRFPLHRFTGFYHGIYWNDALHWLVILNGTHHFKLDMEHPLLTKLQAPGTLSHDNYKLFEPFGSLLLVGEDKCYRKLCIYKMMNEYSGWSSTYMVDLDDIGEFFSKTWQISKRGFFSLYNVFRWEKEKRIHML